MKYVSHLDMNRFMIRMVRMSGIPVWYSEGFNPHPYITFALPLSLGFESDYESMDIRLDKDEFPNDEVLRRLKELMPQGIDVFSCADPIMKAGEISFASFSIDFDTDISAFREELKTFLSSDTIETEKKTKKGTYKKVDIKKFIKDYKLSDGAVELTLAAGGSNNLNPKLLLDTFCDKHNTELPPYSVKRTMLYTADMHCFK